MKPTLTLLTALLLAPHILTRNLALGVDFRGIIS